MAQHRWGLIGDIVLAAALTLPGMRAWGQSHYRFTAADEAQLALELVTHDDMTVSGTLVWREQRYTLSGEWFTRHELAGYMESATGLVLFELELVDPDVYLTLIADGDDGEVLEFELIALDRVPGASLPTSPEPRRSGSELSMPRQMATATPDGERDPRLVGVWAKQDIISDSTMSVATQTLMQVGADGVLSSGPSRTMGGDAGFSADTGVEGDSISVYWRTESQHVLISERPAGPWHPLARYQIDGGKLLMTYYDGSRDLWYRQ